MTVVSYAGAIAAETMPSSDFMKVDIANFGQPWLKFAVQQPKLGSRPKRWDSVLLVRKMLLPPARFTHAEKWSPEAR